MAKGQKDISKSEKLKKLNIKNLINLSKFKKMIKKLLKSKNSDFAKSINYFSNLTFLTLKTRLVFI